MPTIASNPENGLSIECHIETQTQYQLGKPITVKGIIRNSGASALWILRWNTFLQPHCGDCLLVTHNGSPVPYIGLRVLYGNPSAESYIRIPAGGSEERQIDLSELYGIREPGEYQVSFRLSVLGAAEETDAEPPRDRGRLKLTIIESEKVAFRIEGSGSGLPITKVEAPSPSSRTTLGVVYPPQSSQSEI